MPMDLADLLADTLAAQGFEVEDSPPLEGRSGATYPARLVAARDGKRYLVDVLAAEPVDGSDLEALDAVVADTNVDRALLLALADDAEEVGGARDNVEVWARPRVARAVGDRALERALTGDEQPEAIGPSPATDEPEAAPREGQPARQTATGTSGAELLTDDGPPADAEAAPTEPDTGPAGGQPAADPTPAANAADAAEAQPEPAANAAAEPPEPEPEPQPETEPPSADEPDPAGGGGGQFVDPEEMARRAKEMVESGDIPEDGDAELITDDDGAEPEPGAATEEPQAAAGDPATPPPGQGEPAPAEGAPQATPQPEPAPKPEPEPSAQSAGDELTEGQVFEEADAELLPSKPKSEREAERETEPEPEPASGEASPIAAAAPTEPADEEAFLSGGCVEPAVDEAQARHEAEGAVFKVDDARLELLPFHVFDYECRLEGDGTAREEAGRVWVSAQSGAVVGAPGGTLVEDPGVPNERFQGTISGSRAVHEAQDHLIDTLERREELREDHSETAVIERVTLTPDPDTLTLEHLGKAYAPRWRVEGQNGTVFVDALTGDLVTG